MDGRIEMQKKSTKKYRLLGFYGSCLKFGWQRSTIQRNLDIAHTTLLHSARLAWRGSTVRLLDPIC